MFCLKIILFFRDLYFFSDMMIISHENLVYPPIYGTLLMENMMVYHVDPWGCPSKKATKDTALERPSGPTGTKALDVNWRLWRVLDALL